MEQNQKQTEQDKQFLTACQDGDLDTVEDFIRKKGQNPSIQDNEPFKIACRNEQYNVMEYLLDTFQPGTFCGIPLSEILFDIVDTKELTLEVFGWLLSEGYLKKFDAPEELLTSIMKSQDVDDTAYLQLLQQYYKLDANRVFVMCSRHKKLNTMKYMIDKYPPETISGIQVDTLNHEPLHNAFGNSLSIGTGGNTIHNTAMLKFILECYPLGSFPSKTVLMGLHNSTEELSSLRKNIIEQYIKKWYPEPSLNINTPEKNIDVNKDTPETPKKVQPPKKESAPSPISMSFSECSDFDSDSDTSEHSEPEKFTHIISEEHQEALTRSIIRLIWGLDYNKLMFALRTYPELGWDNTHPKVQELIDEHIHTINNMIEISKIRDAYMSYMLNLVSKQPFDLSRVFFTKDFFMKLCDYGYIESIRCFLKHKPLELNCIDLINTLENSKNVNVASLVYTNLKK